ncbi:FAD/NAD(P)-binding domain-containing protein [Xylaria sp. FL0064]|nr:FAD/NAD(P)-binding domain-containing protein [Xylaria sp. FL0064]
MAKIAIIGAGISGLAQYLWLRKVGLLDGNSITIYEARDAQSTSATSTPNPETYNASELYEEILRTGHIIRTWRLSNARGWTLATLPAGGENEKMVMIGRETCCQIFRNRVPDGAIVRRKPMLVFQDQKTQEFDFVIVCDGIWSRTRRALFGGQDGEPYEYAPRYEGLVGCGGFVPSSKLLDTPDGEMNVTLGGNGFFGYGYTTGDAQDSFKTGEVATWWSTYTLDECPDDWRNIDKEDVKEELQKRHLGWQNAVIQKIVKDVEVESLYPTFITPLLPTWEKGGCVLVGDAAHALQPSSGQGASMALEDCESLAILLSHYLREDPESGFEKASKKYSDLRRPRLDMVFKKAQELAGMKQDMGFLQEMLMYFFVWLFSRLRVTEAYERKLSAYDVPTEVLKVIRHTG